MLPLSLSVLPHFSGPCVGFYKHPFGTIASIVSGCGRAIMLACLPAEMPSCQHSYDACMSVLVCMCVCPHVHVCLFKALCSRRGSFPAGSHCSSHYRRSYTRRLLRRAACWACWGELAAAAGRFLLVHHHRPRPKCWLPFLPPWFLG